RPASGGSSDRPSAGPSWRLTDYFRVFRVFRGLICHRRGPQGEAAQGTGVPVPVAPETCTASHRSVYPARIYAGVEHGQNHAVLLEPQPGRAASEGCGLSGGRAFRGDFARGPTARDRTGRRGLGRLLRGARRRSWPARPAAGAGARWLLMLRYMLDTDLCIRVLRDRPPAVRERFNREADGLCISSIVLMELLYGAERSARPEHHRRAVEDFAARLDL